MFVLKIGLTSTRFHDFGSFPSLGVLSKRIFSGKARPSLSSFNSPGCVPSGPLDLETFSLTSLSWIPLTVTSTFDSVLPVRGTKGGMFSVSSTVNTLEKKELDASDLSLSVTVIVPTAKDELAMFSLCLVFEDTYAKKLLGSFLMFFAKTVSFHLTDFFMVHFTWFLVRTYAL